ncbi:MAG: 2-amino-4-hydroxy-6-hydroxymethyldihydropteridine diphosphokinase [Planctomycetota bacterium]
MSESLTAQCLISFGSNLGDRHALIADAAKRISVSPWVHGLQTSRLFQTPPIGGPQGQQPFLNAVAAFNTSASARQILELLQATEQELGRQRRERWDARSIDLDVILHGQLVGGGTGLIVPHPRYTARRFVLEPACDVAAHYRDPRFGWTLKQLAEHLDLGAPSLALVGGDVSTRVELCERLSAEHQIQTFAAPPLKAPMAVVGNAPAMGRPFDTDEEAPTAPPIEIENDDPWVSAYVPRFTSSAKDDSDSNSRGIPRLIARLQHATAETCWPAPHQIWPSGWDWPEYRLEIDDLDWAVSEIASALDSMRCPVHAVTDDGRWW